MDTPQDVATCREIIEKSKDILIVTHEHPTADSVGSSLALLLGLTSLGKKVTVVCPDPITVELSNFIGVNKIVSSLSKQNFTISLDYVEGSIEKVSYNIEGEKFNLVIEPRPGFPPFAQEKVHYAYTSTPCDLIISVDTIHLGGLKRIYENEKELFASKQVLNIDRHPNNARYGTINFIETKITTVELVVKLLDTLGVTFSEDIATNVLNSLFEGTGNFSHPQVSPSTFELAARCMSAGGKKFRSHIGDVHVDVNNPILQNDAPSPGQETLLTDEQGDIGTHEHKEADLPVSQQITRTPDDWLKPKIFKSSGHLL
ncbi:hypothetical protein HY947_05570 [Candidatus Gottesmanbacteria bacterium]|nr:hypothetical protein [Candidatus Gottesmanbacteria bacterium]